MSKAKQQAYEAKINDHISIFGKPFEEHVLYRIKNGAAVTQLLLSVEAVAAMFKIMNSIENDKAEKANARRRADI
jgi:nucleoside diphosphate kinase